MKALLTLSLFTALTTTAFAHPGGSKLVCKSAANSGSTQKTFVSIVRSNGVGWFAPIIKTRIAGKNYTMTTPDEMQNYGETFHNSTLKVITATVEVPSEETGVGGYLSIVAIPETVKAFDYEGNPVKWSLEAEKDECNDVYGKATFQAIIHGSVYENSEQHPVETQVMDCKLEYNPGMSC